MKQFIPNSQVDCIAVLIIISSICGSVTAANIFSSQFSYVSKEGTATTSTWPLCMVPYTVLFLLAISTRFRQQG